MSLLRPGREPYFVRGKDVSAELEAMADESRTLSADVLSKPASTVYGRNGIPSEKHRQGLEY